MGGLFALKADVATHAVERRGPTIMFTSFLGAVLFAVGHHILNLKLDGKAVGDIAVDQQWISRAGNALAYIVKVLLVLATGTAYFQRVWHHARGKPTKLSQFDSLLGVPDNILELRHAVFWFRRPILLLAVLVLWYVHHYTTTTCSLLFKSAFRLRRERSKEFCFHADH